MKLLLIAMLDSIHTARWLSQITDQGWDIHLYSSKDFERIHPEIKNVTSHQTIYGKHALEAKTINFKGFPVYFEELARFLRKVIIYFFPNYRARKLAKIINKIKPDIVHSLEIQHAGYLTLAARKYTEVKFPTTIVTNWGSDIYLFSRLSEHKDKINKVLESSDYYSCECERDVELALKNGFKNRVLPVFPNTGGYKLEKISRLKAQRKVSERRLIMLKGYQNWAGRALVGLRALARASDILEDYEVIIYSANDDVKIAGELLTNLTGIKTTVIPKETPHDDILKLHGHARISIGLSISDAISTSLLEAIVMGSFPIQSWTSCGSEWIEDGKTGILVPPEDPDVVEKAIRRALSDDQLVNSAAQLNWLTAEQKLDHNILKIKTINFYNEVFDS